MHGEESSYTLLVEVNGQQLPPGLAGLLASGYVDNQMNAADMFVLRFTDDGSGVLQKGGFDVGVAVRLLVQKSGGAGPQPIMTGEITALEAELDSVGMHLLVRGLDKSHRLFRGRRIHAYLQMTAADIVKKVAQGAGLSLGRIDCPGPVLAHVGQDGVSDWEFLRGLADEVGGALDVVDGKLNFCKPTDAAGAPSDQQASQQNPLVIEHGVNLVSVRATVTAADQVPEVEVRGWDVDGKQPIVAVKQAGTHSAKLDSVNPGALASAVGGLKWVESVSGYRKQQQCDALAVALADRLAGSFAELDGVVRGNPDMRAGKAVALGKIGKPFDGSYTLSSTRHEFSPETGYLTSFTVSNASDRSLFGVASASAVAPRSKVMTGVIVGLVTDVKDPEHRGRVKVTFPVMSDDYASWWARTVQPGAGAGRGAIVLPEVGDEVLVAFGMGDFDEPYVLGGLYNGKDAPTAAWADHVNETDGSVQRRAFVSRTGMVVEMIEKPGEEKLTLSTSSGEQRITLTQKGETSIEIISTGPLTVTADKEVAVSSKSGDISVKGKNIKLDAQADLTLTGSNVTITAQVAASLSGATVKVAGDATAELSASGQTAVRGGMVMIN